MSQPPNQPYSGYPEHGGQSYPGYPQPHAQPYPGHSQPPEQSYPGYPQPHEQSYPGYGQPQGQTFGVHSQFPNQPVSGYPVPPGTPATPPKKSSVGKIVLIAVVALLVLCGGGSAVAFFALKDDVQEVTKATQTHVVAPETLAGRPKMTEPQLQEAADKMVAEMRNEVENAKETVGAFYGDPSEKDMIMIAAASGLVADPAREVDDGIRGLAAGGLKLSDITAIEPGPLGGIAKCGDANAEGIEMGVCVWADRGSVGVIAIYFKTAAQAKAEFVKIRGEIEQRS